MGERSKFETHALLDRWPTVRDGGRERVCERTPRADGDGPESRAWVRRTRASTSVVETIFVEQVADWSTSS